MSESNSDDSGVEHCRHCGASVEPTWTACPECGEALSAGANPRGQTGQTRQDQPRGNGQPQQPQHGRQPAGQQPSPQQPAGPQQPPTPGQAPGHQQAGPRHQPQPADGRSAYAGPDQPDGENILTRTLRNTTSVIPGAWRLWRALSVAGVRGMKKATGGDAIAMVGRPNGSVEPVPVKWRDASHHDEDVAKWVSLDGKEEWAAGPEGRGVDLWDGKTPVIWCSEDSHEIGSEVQARVAEAWDMQRYDDLYANPQVEQILVDADPEYDDAEEAVADGGVEVVNEQLVSEGELVDKLIDIGAPRDLDGVRISLRKYTEMYPERPASEEYQMQETRGRIAEQDGEGDQIWWKVALLILATVALTLGIPALLGGGGGGGGGVSIPLGMLWMLARPGGN